MKGVLRGWNITGNLLHASRLRVSSHFSSRTFPKSRKSLPLCFQSPLCLSTVTLIPFYLSGFPPSLLVFLAVDSPGKSLWYSLLCLPHKGKLWRRRREKNGSMKAHCLSAVSWWLESSGTRRGRKRQLQPCSESRCDYSSKSNPCFRADRFVTFRIVHFNLQELWPSSFIHTIQVLTEEWEISPLYFTFLSQLTLSALGSQYLSSNYSIL